MAMSKKTKPVCRNECSDAKPPTSNCRVRSPDGYYCTRDKGHKGKHSACTPTEHDLKVWKSPTDSDVIRRVEEEKIAQGIPTSHGCSKLSPESEGLLMGNSFPLFKHMADTYNLTLVEDELRQIINKADESRMKAHGHSEMVKWALVNALYHLNIEQMHELGEAIAKRSGGTFTVNKEEA